MSEDPLFEKGLEKRRSVLGAEYVDASLARATDFTRPLQELITRYCWGDVWTRDGLTARDRSLINLGMITALNRPAELKLHVRGALVNGLSVDEIRETLLQTTVYCGVPAALEAFRVAQEVLDEAEDEAGR